MKKKGLGEPKGRIDGIQRGPLSDSKLFMQKSYRFMFGKWDEDSISGTAA